MDVTSAVILLVGLLIGLVCLFAFFRYWFRNLANEALVQNQLSFLNIAKSTLETAQTEAKGDLAQKEQAIRETIQPLKGMLKKYEHQITELESKRERAYGSLRQYIESVSRTQTELRQETSHLVSSLRSPNVRGAWGEITLKRVVELAGMNEHSDFDYQQSVPNSDSRLRPDLVVNLPNGRRIAVDAKVPLEGYLEAQQTTNKEEKNRLLTQCPKHLQRHVKHLGSKAYWEQLEGGPEFVVLFLPLESLYSDVLHQDRNLLETSIEKGVFIASPVTVIALLRSVEHGWREERLAKNAEKIRDLGHELYSRLQTLSGHWTKLGVSLTKAVQAYDDTAGSLEKRVLVQARKLKELRASSRDELPEAYSVNQRPKGFENEITAPPGDRSGL